ncbi:unnamed protein product [Urochloa humidicola]
MRLPRRGMCSARDSAACPSGPSPGAPRLACGRRAPPHIALSSSAASARYSHRHRLPAGLRGTLAACRSSSCCLEGRSCRIFRWAPRPGWPSRLDLLSNHLLLSTPPRPSHPLRSSYQPLCAADDDLDEVHECIGLGLLATVVAARAD